MQERLECGVLDRFAAKINDKGLTPMGVDVGRGAPKPFHIGVRILGGHPADLQRRRLLGALEQRLTVKHHDGSNQEHRENSQESCDGRLVDDGAITLRRSWCKA